MCLSTRWVALLALLFASGAAAEPCKMGRAAQLAVTMDDMQPLVHAAINGKDALFLADSGAFFSILSPAGARQFSLSLEPASPGFSLYGVGGDAQVWITTVKTFTIFKLDLRNVPFIVAGNDMGHGTVGVLGQNVFQLGDIEYDLADGVINILRTHGDCRQTSLAYWASDKNLPYSRIAIDFARAENPRTTGEAHLNGTRIRVQFDTGASFSLLSLDAAKRAGVTPESAGVTAGGMVAGAGRHAVRTWIAPVASFKIGDEEIRNTHLRIGDIDLHGVDMLLGTDFFLSHRILAANSQRQLYFTYNGGPVFNLTTVAAQPPGTAAPSVASATGASAPDSDTTLDAAGYARRGSASAARRDYGSAIADLTKAIALDPVQPDFLYERARAYMAEGHADQAIEDLSQTLKLRPGDVPALMARAELHARRDDPAEIITADLDAVDRAAPRQGDVRMTLGRAYAHIGNYPAAITQYSYWIDSRHSDDVNMAEARNARCRARALAGQALDQALDDCNFAVRREPKNAAFLDARGLVYLRKGQYAKAIADYDASLTLVPKKAWALYGRGVARQRLGQIAAGQADIAAATALSPKVAAEAERYGIAPGL